MNGKKAKDINLIANNLLKDWIIRNTGNTDDFNPNDVERYLPCLLYTSPSPRDATLSRMPSSA